MNTRFVSYCLAESTTVHARSDAIAGLILAFCLGALALWCVPDFVAWLCGTGVVTL